MVQRTYKAISRPLNQGKRAVLADLAESFASEKQRWLMELQKPENPVQANRYKSFCAQVITHADYQSPYGLSKRMAKAALRSACMTMQSYWGGVLGRCSTLIFRRSDWDAETKREHANKLLLRNVPDILAGKHGAYLRRILHRERGAYPVVKSARSLLLDSSLYRVFEEKDGALFISVTTKQRGARVVIPLLGKVAIHGDIRLVLVGDHVEVHVCSEVHAGTPDTGVIEAIDKGYTEAFTNQDGETFGIGLGDQLTRASNWLNRKMKNRHRLHAYEKSLRDTDARKAAVIRKHNLGTQKLDARMRKAKVTAERIVNEGLNQFFRQKHPEVLVSEDLTHQFRFKNGKKVNRRLSGWIKGVIAERVQFKALAAGCRHEIVNAAYSSQACPNCGFVDGSNRKGDVFECLHCGHAAHADRVAAKNLLARWRDPEITRYTPYRKVKAILLDRFHRWLQPGPESGLGSVPARRLSAGDNASI
jgi:transposase